MGAFEAAELERAASGALASADPRGRPAVVRVWSDEGAFLVIARCEAAATGSPDRSHPATVAKLAHDVASAFYIRTGLLLSPCGRTCEPRRGLLVLAFELVSAESLEAHRGLGGCTPLADAG